MLRYLLAIVVGMAAATAAGSDELLVFTMPGCRPCAYMKAALERNPDLVRHLKIVHVDITEQPGTAEAFHVSSVPVLVRLRGDDEIARLVGSTNDRGLRNWISAHDEK